MTEPDPELYDTCSCHVCATLRSLLVTDLEPQLARSPTATQPSLLLTTDQAATMLGVSRDVVSQLIGQGELRSVEVNMLYPPDATPPQLLTVKTLE